MPTLYFMGGVNICDLVVAVVFAVNPELKSILLMRDIAA